MSNKNRCWILMGKKLSGSASMDEEKELDSLFQRHPDVWYAYELLGSMHEKDNIPEEFIDEINSLLENDVSTDITKPVYRPAYQLLLKLTTSVVILLVIFWSANWTYNYIQNKLNAKNNNIEIAVLNGTRTDVTLPDGSRVILNAGSKLTYPKNFKSLKVREVFLSGEAYFKIVHNPLHSFIIHTNYFDIKDIGTTFNVKAYPGEKTSEASLIEGSIEIFFKPNQALKTSQVETIKLKANQKMVLVNRTSIPDNILSKADNAQISYKVVKLTENIESSNLLAETSWINDELVFKNDTFEDLAIKMERKYNTAIVFDDDNVKEFMITGAFKTQNINQALKTLQLIIPFTYRVDRDTIHIQSSKK